MKYLILVILAITAVSCGTIGSRRDITPVDSKTRGVSIYDEDKNFMGKTPFFYEIDKGLWQKFYYQDGKEKKDLNYICNVNWSESIIPNLIPAPFFPIGTAISAGFVAIDALTGDAFSCHDKVYVDDAVVAEESFQRRILVLPIGTDDAKDSFELINLFVKSRGLEKDVIDLEQAEAELNFFGIDGDSVKGTQTIPKEHLYEIAYKLKATHLLFLKLKDKLLHPKLRDLFTGKLVVEQATPYDVPARFFKKKSILKKLGKYFSFFPNSLTLSTQVGSTISDEVRNSSDVKRHPDAMPLIFSVFGLTNIRNPRQLSPWDFEFSAGPTLEAPAFRYQTDNYWLNAQRYALLMEPALTLHTPFGAVALAIGLGPSYSYGDDSDGAKYREFNLLSTKIGLSYYAFFRERFFFKASVNTHQIKQSEFGGKANQTLTQTTLSLGYYIPHLKGKLRYLMPF